MNLRDKIKEVKHALDNKRHAFDLSTHLIMTSTNPAEITDLKALAERAMLEYLKTVHDYYRLVMKHTERLTDD